jgi:hypothetical protein
MEDHGKLTELECYEGCDDSTVERLMINSVREKGYQSGVRDTKAGRTEFFKISELPSGLDHFRNILTEHGYVKNTMSKTEFTPPTGKNKGPYISGLFKVIEDFKRIDAVILTFSLAGCKPTEDMEEFNRMCELIGQENDWCTHAMLRAGKWLAKEWPDGVLNHWY